MSDDSYKCPKCGGRFSDPDQCPNCEGASSLPAPSGSAEWDATLVANVVANCRQQIERLRMKMPINVALALGRADEELADAQAWMRAESNIGTYENPPTTTNSTNANSTTARV